MSLWLFATSPSSARGFRRIDRLTPDNHSRKSGIGLLGSDCRYKGALVHDGGLESIDVPTRIFLSPAAVDLGLPIAPYKSPHNTPQKAHGTSQSVQLLARFNGGFLHFGAWSKRKRFRHMNSVPIKKNMRTEYHRRWRELACFSMERGRWCVRTPPRRRQTRSGDPGKQHGSVIHYYRPLQIRPRDWLLQGKLHSAAAKLSYLTPQIPLRAHFSHEQILKSGPLEEQFPRT